MVGAVSGWVFAASSYVTEGMGITCAFTTYGLIYGAISL